MAEILTPRQLERYNRYRTELHEQANKHGELFAEVWAAAQQFLAARGRVRRPPRKWSFLAALRAAPPGQSPSFTPEQRAEWRQFWDWYLPLERGIGRLIWVIEVLHKLGPEHTKLKSDVCQVAYVAKTQYQQWLEDGEIVWLPVGRGGGKPETIVQLLDQVLVKRDRGPERDAGDPGYELEPMP